MGFTIGAASGRFAPARGAAPARPRCTAVAEYTGLWGWAVVPGARAVTRGRRPYGLLLRGRRLPRPRRPSAGLRPASCGRARRWRRPPRPGPRPRAPRCCSRWAGRSTSSTCRRPRAAAPWCGWSGWGCRWARSRPPRPGRALFFVAPGAAAELPRSALPDGLGRRRRSTCAALGPGDHVTAPPSDLGGLGPVRWLRPPAPGHRRPPAAGPAAAGHPGLRVQPLGRLIRGTASRSRRRRPRVGAADGRPAARAETSAPRYPPGGSGGR